jgi:hypothetical protein
LLQRCSIFRLEMSKRTRSHAHRLTNST